LKQLGSKIYSDSSIIGLMKYPDDFGGWLPLGTMLNGRYLILEKPDHKYQALIHLEDNDVVEVMEMRSGEAVYSHPLNLEAAKALMELVNLPEWFYKDYVIRHTKP
jgi:hypothetical protein